MGVTHRFNALTGSAACLAFHKFWLFPPRHLWVLFQLLAQGKEEGPEFMPRPDGTVFSGTELHFLWDVSPKCSEGLPLELAADSRLSILGCSRSRVGYHCQGQMGAHLVSS